MQKSEIDKSRAFSISRETNNRFLKLPYSLFANPKYTDMSLSAKVAYSLLRDRLTLSQKNGWVDENNLVYLIYSRQEMANFLNVGLKKITSVFQELLKYDLVFEVKRGLGKPNLIYVYDVEISDGDEYDGAIEHLGR